MTIEDPDAFLNDFATRSFRDTADRDYANARLAYRARLVPQFQWSALHCLEKYAKGILLFNRIPATNLRHTVSPALELFRTKGNFNIELSPATCNLIRRLETGAHLRYLEASYHTAGIEISGLDQAVSELRRYCQPINLSPRGVARHPDYRETMLNRIEKARATNPRDTCIYRGWLEKTIDTPNHPARPAITWRNAYFGLSRHRPPTNMAYFEGENAPLQLSPQHADLVRKYVYYPSDLTEMWRQLAVERKKERDAN